MSGRFSVGTLSATYRLPRPHPDETGVRLRLDAVARRLDRSLDAPLSRLAAGREDEVWLFRRLDAEIELDLAADDDALASAWAGGVAAAVASRLGARRHLSPAAAPEVADGVVCFPDRAAQLADLVADLAAGTAWSHWWHREFDGLRPLPPPAAIETALRGDAARARAALTRLAAAGRLDAVSRALGAPASARIVDALYGETPAGSPAAAAEAAVRAAALGLAGEAATLYVCAAVDAGAPPFGRPLASAPPRTLAAVARQAAAAAADPVPQPSRDDVAKHANAVSHTRLGGAFLLLRALARLGSELDPETRLLVLRSALGRERAAESGADAVLADVAGVVADELAAPAYGTLPAALVRLLVEAGRTDGAALSVVPTGLGRLLLDAGRDAWLGIAREDGIDALLDTVAAVTGQAPRVVGLPAEVAAGAVRAELGWFALPDAEPEVAVAGRAVLRELAWRLGGFERSSTEHLWRNVLDRTARVERHAAGMRVELGPAPLDVLLRLSGIACERFDVPWLGEVGLALAP